MTYPNDIHVMLLSHMDDSLINTYLVVCVYAVDTDTDT